MPRASLNVDFREQPDVSRFPLYDINMVDYDARLFIKPPGAGLVLCYISLTELGKDVSYRELAKNVPVLGRNEEWNSDVVDFRTQAWAALLVSVMRARADRCDGYFLDTAAGYWHPSLPQFGPVKEFQDATAKLIKQLAGLFPNKKLIPNRCFEIALEIKAQIAGFLCEGVLWSNDGMTSRQQSQSKTDEIRRLIDPIQNAGLPIYIIDYPPAGQARAVVDQLMRFGYRALATTPDLYGTVLADDATSAPVKPATPAEPAHYRVIESATPEGLAIKFAALALDGWHAQGGVSILPGRYAQAVIR